MTRRCGSALWRAETSFWAPGRPKTRQIRRGGRPYALEVIRSDFAEAGDEDVARKILADLDSAGVEIDAATVRQKMDELLIVAATQIESEA